MLRRIARLSRLVVMAATVSACVVTSVTSDVTNGPQVDRGPLPVAPLCLGVARATCLEMAATGLDDTGPGGGVGPAVVRITVRCTAVCTPRQGEGETRIDFADGTNAITGWGYQSAGVPAPPEPSGTIAPASP